MWYIYCINIEYPIIRKKLPDRRVLMYTSSAFNSNVSTSNVFGTNNISSVRENKNSRSNDIFQGNPRSRADTVSISSGAMDVFQLELKKSIEKDDYKPEYDSDGELIIPEVVYNDSHLSLNEAVYNRIVSKENWA